jgi:hypothetical protein
MKRSIFVFLLVLSLHVKGKNFIQKNIGKDSQAMLTIKTFPNGNHNLFTCRTEGMREKLDKVEFCDGYFETMSAWLKRVSSSQ